MENVTSQDVVREFFLGVHQFQNRTTFKPIKKTEKEPTERA